jgi:hypothetical protein
MKTETTPFIEFPKIARFSREVIVTEKIDGTSACVYIGEDGEFLTGSRNRWITPESDNRGFSRWAHEHKEELMTLGPGRHFGEWWGNGIQRGYGLQNGDKRFSLFNVTRWCLHGETPKEAPTQDPRVFLLQKVLPPCVGLVPVLWRGLFEDFAPVDLIWDLKYHGSVAAPGFMNPEGIVVYHTAGNVGFKKTIEKDGQPKSLGTFS